MSKPVNVEAISGQSPAPEPPVAHKETMITQLHGFKLEDDYFWMRDKSNPEVCAYLEAENTYADAVMMRTAPLQEKLYAEMLSRIKETDVQAPYREGEFFYYSRTEQGRQYSILCRKHGSLDAAEEVTLDVNQLAEGQSFMALGVYAVSDDGRLLAYATDNTGFRQYTLHVKDLQTGAVMPDLAQKVGTVAWANDNRTIFYTVEDHAKRQYRLYWHAIDGAEPANLVYEEEDERFTVRVCKSRSKQFVFLESESHTTTEVRYLPADKPGDPWRLMEPRQPGIEYYPDHRGDSFYLRVNDTGRNFRIVKAAVGDPAKVRWQEVVAHRPEAMIEDLQLFRNFLVVMEREAGLQEIRITDLTSGNSDRVVFPEPAYTLSPDNNREFDCSQFRYRYTSFLTPLSVYDHDMEKHVSTLLKRTEVLGNFDPGEYAVERAYATAKDGARIPISILHLKSIRRDGTAPVYLYAYGAYGIPSNIAFNSNRFSLVDRGMVFAVAHIRGGGDLGKVWHDDGRMMKKMNTFTDFIACAEYLTSPHTGSGNGAQPIQYADRNHLIIEGGSAGGLLMGAVVNLRPELFKVVIAKVPFVDVINTMLDESLPLTVGEFEEWGNPKQKQDFEYMVQYSPYENLNKAAYPAMLMKTSFNDSQVMYWEPAKYVARLRTLDTGKNVVLLKTNMGAGHGGASGRYDYLHEVAFDYAFILGQAGFAE